MSGFGKFVIILIGILYVLWPVDLMPGLPIDDIAAIILICVICTKNGINLFPNDSSDETEDHHDEW